MGSGELNKEEAALKGGEWCFNKEEAWLKCGHFKEAGLRCGHMFALNRMGTGNLKIFTQDYVLCFFFLRTLLFVVFFGKVRKVVNMDV